MKYRITSGRWDVPMEVYMEFDATNDGDTTSDEKARKVFREITEHKENSWETMFLHRVDQVEKTTILATVRV